MKRIQNSLKNFNLVGRLIRVMKGMNRQWTGQRITFQSWAGKVLYAGLMTCVGLALAACNKSLPIPASAPESQKPPAVVKDYYSDSIVVAEIRDRTYRIPMNYFPIWTWKNYQWPDKYKIEFLNIHLFHPAYDGYTRELTSLMFSAPYNAPSLTEVQSLEHMKKMIFVAAVFPLSKRELEQPKADPASESAKESWYELEKYGRSELGSIVENRMHGLRCLSPSTNPDFLRCQGLTHKGELLHFKCDKTWLTAQLGACGIAHSSLKEGYAAYYEFAQDLLPHWREVNEAVFQKMKSWEQK